MRGRIVAERGDAQAGVEEMSQAYAMWAATGAVVTTPFYLALQAEGLALAGRPDEGLTLLRRALGIVTQYGERYYEAEIRRLIGELMLQSATLHGRDESGEAGQERLKASTALVSRCGGLGGCVAQSLAAAGIGRLVLAHGGLLAPGRARRTTTRRARPRPEAPRPEVCCRPT